MRSDMTNEMVGSVIVAFTEAALKIASVLFLGFDGGVRRVEGIHGGRRVIEHGGRGALRGGRGEREWVMVRNVDKASRSDEGGGGGE
jgi:hypothetical protein